MDEEQRKELGELIKAQRISQFGTVTEAIRVAIVNTETWNRAERGDKIRDDRMAAIVKALWPSSGGMWQKIAPETHQAGVVPVSVDADDDDLFELKMRRPEGMSVEEWKRRTEEYREEFEWKILRAAQER